MNRVKTEAPATTRTPSMDVRRTEAGWTVTADVPGARREDLEVLLEEDLLTLTAPIEDVTPEGYSRVHGELSRGAWKRSFRLPAEVDADGLEARLADGVLTLDLPRRAPRERRVRIQVAGAESTA